MASILAPSPTNQLLSRAGTITPTELSDLVTPATRPIDLALNQALAKLAEVRTSVLNINPTAKVPNTDEIQALYMVLSNHNIVLSAQLSRTCETILSLREHGSDFPYVEVACSCLFSISELGKRGDLKPKSIESVLKRLERTALSVGRLQSRAVSLSEPNSLKQIQSSAPDHVIDTLFSAHLKMVREGGFLPAFEEELLQRFLVTAAQYRHLQLDEFLERVELPNSIAPSVDKVVRLFDRDLFHRELSDRGLFNGDFQPTEAGLLQASLELLVAYQNLSRHLDQPAVSTLGSALRMAEHSLHVARLRINKSNVNNYNSVTDVIARSGFLPLPTVRELSLADINRAILAGVGHIWMPRINERVAFDGLVVESGAELGAPEHDLAHLIRSVAKSEGSDRVHPEWLGAKEQDWFASVLRRLAFSSVYGALYCDLSEHFRRKSPEHSDAFEAIWLDVTHETGRIMGTLSDNIRELTPKAGQRFAGGVLFNGRETDNISTVTSRIRDPIDFALGLPSGLKTLNPERIRRHLTEVTEEMAVHFYLNRI